MERIIIIVYSERFKWVNEESIYNLSCNIIDGVDAGKISWRIGKYDLRVDLSIVKGDIVKESYVSIMFPPWQIEQMQDRKIKDIVIVYKDRISKELENLKIKEETNDNQ